MNTSVKRRWVQIYVATCPVCGREVKGFTERQAKTNLQFHIQAKHGGGGNG